GGTMNNARSRRSSRAAYRWYLLNNPQAVGVSYRNFSGGTAYASTGSYYGPVGRGSCGMGGCGIGGCATGACGAAGCSTGQCGVSYNPATASTPTPDPNSGNPVPPPREVESTTPKTFADEPMNSGNPGPGVEDSGFEQRRYDRSPMNSTPMPKDEANDLFQPPVKPEGETQPVPRANPIVPENTRPERSQPDFGPEKKEDSNDLFGGGNPTDAFKVTPDGKLPETAIPQKKSAPIQEPAIKAPKAEQETNFPPLRVRPLNLDQKITWKSAPRAERLTIRTSFSAPRVAKQDVPVNSGWFAITDSAKIASK
ncbi:MAG TPA: hypothetical protein DCM07_03545, partial [Planctomycetaceae bacterium]|nr:hypothetical protein [Planctomycetaceae bacterium]